MGNDSWEKSSVPVTVSMTKLASGSRFMTLSGGYHALALVAVGFPNVTSITPAFGSTASVTILNSLPPFSRKVAEP